MRAVSTARTFLRENGLSITVVLLFLIFLVGQILTGLLVFNEEQREHGETPVTIGEYLRSGHFAEVTEKTGKASFCKWLST